MLLLYLKLEHNKQNDRQEFLNSVSKLVQLSVLNTQKRLMLRAMVELVRDCTHDTFVQS